MPTSDVISKWSGTVQFALSTSSPRRLILTKAPSHSVDGLRIRMGDAAPWDYVEVDNRGNKGATIYYAFNGTEATAILKSTFSTADGAHLTLGAASTWANFRLPPDSIDRVLAHATRISALAQGNATTIYLTVGRF